MKIIKNPETKGILALVLIILLLGGTMAATGGKLEQWFGITLFSGPQALDRIVFVSERDGSADLYLMSTDGTGVRRLTRGAGVQSVPAISGSGNRVLFIAGSGGSEQVFSVGVKGGTPAQVSTATGPKLFPSYSPNRKTLSYIASGKVYSAALDGSKLETVLPTPEEIRQSMVSVEGSRGKQILYSHYEWGPDGNSIAGVTSDDSGNDYLVYLPEPDAEPVRIMLAPEKERSRVLHISWAQSRPVLAVSLLAGKESVVRLFDAEAVSTQDSNPVATVIQGEGVRFGKPALSPDGLLIAIPAYEEQEAGLLVRNLTTGEIVPLAAGEFENPSFSPSGDTILATRVTEDGRRDIVTIDPSTGQVTELTTDGKSHNAIWTPAARK